MIADKIKNARTILFVFAKSLRGKDFCELWPVECPVKIRLHEIQSPCVRSLYLNIPQLLSPMGERGCGIFGWICKVVAMLFLRRQYYIVTFYSWIKNIFFIKGKNTTPT